jgi:hypothetical protein
MRYTHIKLVFENCEEVKFKASDISFLGLKNITTSYSYLCAGKLRRIQTINDFFIVIKKEANAYNRYLTPLYDDARLPFDRILLIPDIAQVHLDTSHMFYVKYDGEEYNTLQSAKLSLNGDLCISINAEE